MNKNMRIKNLLPKLKAGLAILVMVLAFFVSNINIARAGTPITPMAPISNLSNLQLGLQSAAAMPGLIVSDVGAKTQTFLGRMITTIEQKAASWYKTYGTQIYNTTLRNTLNRVALDAAKYVASAGEGQQPQYIVQNYKDYWKGLGDAAAGDFIDQVGKSWQVDLCQPPDPAVRLKIGLGLTQTQAPQAPNCTLSNLLNNYSTAFEKYQAMQSGDYLKALQVNFDPGGSELGAAFEVFGRTFATSTNAVANAKDTTAVTGGWLDVRDIAGNLKSTPGNAKTTLDNAKQTQLQAMLSTTGNALLDAANIFLNQLAYEGMQRALRELSKGKTTTTNNSSSAFTSLIQFGENVVSEKLATIIKPRFDVRSDYTILSDLAICPDKNNPGPNNCVIDENFSQAISEKLTVGDALAQGYLHGDWLVTTNDLSDSAYTLRSATILRKFRIVPVGWEQAISATEGKKVTFQDLVSCFDPKKLGTFSSEFDQTDTRWCNGLVDPNWVLKAPLNSCVKQGAGGQINSSLVSKDENGVSNVVISRASDYCADEQTCVKEKADGSCELYGYCNEEKRTWNFSSDSCQPVYNTCQTFSNATSKQSVSYLENTLDYSTCNANNSGCKQYVYGGAYDSSTGKVAWDKKYSIYLNSKATNCSTTSEGCTKLLRGKPGWQDVNYVMNSDFAANQVGDTATSTNWDYQIKVGTAAIGDPDGDGKALYLDGVDNTALVSDASGSLLPQGLTVIPGWSYTLSADVKLLSADKVTMILGNDAASTELITQGVWTTISVTASTEAQSLNNLNFKLTGSGTNASFAVRNLKLSPNDYAPDFSTYGLIPAYEKLIPPYLESACYNNVTSGTNDYSLKANAPAVCNNFARKCNREEVGCELFTAVKDNFSIAAKANPSDYCDAKCVGYDTYLAKASYFYGTSADNIIPANSTTCSAESAGCASFTNLDAAAAGGESLEYYSQVRQCIKPDVTSCGDFYSWDNSQLKVMSLKKDSGQGPAVVDPAADALCNKNIYNLSPSDPNYNPDCREFYSKSGQITYHTYSNTISCSDNCHTYRLNEKNIDKTLTTQKTCEDSANTWDTTQGACYVCKNGGTWNAKQNACLYQAIPDEGTTCAAEEVGCREYNGSNGNNLKQVASYDFESGLNGFSGLAGGNVSQSLESTAKNGHSLAYAGSGTSGFAVNASSFATKNSAYVIKFTAKATANVTANFAFVNATGTISAFNVDDNNSTGNVTIKGDGQWNIYEINLKNLDHDPSAEQLRVKANNNLFIDNVVINEISDRYYLIKGTSQVPDECSYDISGKYQGPNYNLGCAQYKDRANTIHNLNQFSELCQDSAVGCEQMIQTNNSSNYQGYTLNLNATDRNTACVPGSAGCLEVKGHQAIYAVYDESKLCNIADLGCSRFAYAQTSGGLTTWVDSYKKNLPDTYQDQTASPLCQANEVGCDTWSYGDGSNSFFKDPGTNTCIYKDNAWQKSPVSRCDTNTVGDSNGKITGTEKDGPTCLTNADCNGKVNCIVDTNVYDCHTSYTKTFGFGGSGGKVETPDQAVGLCDAGSATCSEYIDPVSKFVNNLVYNPTAEDIDGNGQADKWNVDSPAGYYSQQISVQPFKLYILQVSGLVSSPVRLDKFSNSANTTGAFGKVQILSTDSSNQLGDPVSVVIASTSPTSISFYTGDNKYLNVYRFGTTTSATTDKTSITIREAIVNYQLSSNIDTKSCTVSNTDGGCILFNARTQAGASGLKQLTYNAAATTEGSGPIACQGNNCSANQLVKVSPDRICSRWLSCRTYIEDPITHQKTCYAMGECDSLNDKNECIDWLPLDNVTRNISNPQNKNATGYALLNNYYLGSMKEVGQNTDAHFDFESSAVGLSCRRNIDVAGTALNDPSFRDNACGFDSNINESLVLEPNGAPTNYPAHGVGYLKVLNYYQMSPMPDNSYISVYPNQNYYINYLVNTKGSGAKAKLVIVDDKSNTIARFVDQSDNGWVRVVHTFNIKSTSGSNVQSKIKIYLTSDVSNTNSGYVYFDDINIEPVLKTGDNTYVSKDCRLYPADDSLSCLSANNNVIKDGLYGYCLQYDPLNPGVCLMWYPVDQISPVVRNNQSTLGYSGKFPLYYCSEVNGKFNLMKKVSVVKVGDWHYVAQDPRDDMCTILPKTAPVSKFPWEGNGPSGGCEFWCGVGNCDKNYDAVITHNKGGKGSGGDWQYYKAYCIPKVGTVGIGQKTTVYDSALFQEGSKEQACKDISLYTEAWTEFGNGFVKRNNPGGEWGTGATDNFDESKNLVPNVAVYDETKPRTIDSIKYVGDADPNNVYRLTCNRFTELVDSQGANMAWAGRLSRNSNFTTTTPSFFYNIDANYSYAQKPKPSGAVVNCNDSSECQTNQTCVGLSADCGAGIYSDPNYSDPNNYVQQPICRAWNKTDCEGTDGCLWTVYNQGTCTDNVSDNPYVINFYGRNREDVPFGAAVLPSNYDLANSARISLRNQYSQNNNETILAGRPYGCSTSAASTLNDGCKYIGQCSLDPNVFCFYAGPGNSDVNKLSCSAGGNGECVPLWNFVLSPIFGGSQIPGIPTVKDNNNILNKLFIKDYGDFSFQNGYQTASSTFNWAYKNGTDIVDNECPGGGRPDDPIGSFCTVFPVLSNTQLKFINPAGGDSPISLINNEAVLSTGGLYHLDFNTAVDVEQQPLKQIVIDWGDSVQVISNTDNMPNSGVPHQFYHYYTGSNEHIEIKIVDNWGAWTCVSTFGGTWVADKCTNL